MKRHKNIVGKYIGGRVYVHRQYAHLVVPCLQEAIDLLRKSDPDWQYNVVVWDAKKSIVRFCASPDFDTASEPIVGMTVAVNLGNKTIGKFTEYMQVWHRKHLWVMGDYGGFDVTEAEKWAEEWTSKLSGKEKADGSSRSNWFAQLARHEITAPK